MRKRCWKSCVREMCYCRPGLNKKILCLRESLHEVCRILNSGICHGCDKNNREGRC